MCQKQRWIRQGPEYVTLRMREGASRDSIPCKHLGFVKFGQEGCMVCACRTVSGTAICQWGSLPLLGPLGLSAPWPTARKGRS